MNSESDRSSTGISDSHAEETLVNKAILGDLDAFNELVMKYQDTIYYRAYSILGNQADAEDVTQDGFIRAFQALRQFRGGSFRGWLMKIVTNGAYDMLRRSKRHPDESLYPTNESGEEVESPKWLVDPSPSVQSVVEQNDASARIHQLLAELPEVFRSVITLVDLYEYDYVETAQALQIPVGTVKSRLARARMQMQNKLRNHSEYFNIQPEIV